MTKDEMKYFSTKILERVAKMVNEEINRIYDDNKIEEKKELEELILKICAGNGINIYNGKIN